jgi:septum formation protein
MGFVFEIEPPDYEEIIIPDQSPEGQIQKFALGKAKSVYERLKNGLEGDVMIWGFDSMISFEGKSIGKPKTKKAAFEMIQEFVGKPQAVMSGMACVGMWKGKYFEQVTYESTAIQFRPDITNCQIRSYLEFGDWEGKCGSYSILGTGIFFLESIVEDFQNIVGIPVIKMGEMMREITGKSPFSSLKPV